MDLGDVWAGAGESIGIGDSFPLLCVQRPWNCYPSFASDGPLSFILPIKLSSWSFLEAVETAAMWKEKTPRLDAERKIPSCKNGKHQQKIKNVELLFQPQQDLCLFFFCPSYSDPICTAYVWEQEGTKKAVNWRLRWSEFLVPDQQKQQTHRQQEDNLF